MNTTTFDTWLVNGNITIFCGSHTDSFKKDILASCLYGELLAAQKSSNRAVSWPVYTDFVQKIGWAVNSRSTQHLAFENSSLLNAIEQSTGNSLPQDERQSLTHAFAQLLILEPDSPAIRTFLKKLETNAIEIKKADTEAAASTATLLTIIRNDKNVVTQQLAFETSNELAIDILDQPVLSASNDQRTNCWQLCSSLDEHQYNRVRDDILKKLGNKMKTELLHLSASAGLD